MDSSTEFKKKLIIHTLLIFIGLFFIFQCVNADLIDTTRSGMFKYSRCRNVAFYHISHNQVFRPGDSINFGFTAECQNPAISCGTAQVTAYLSGTRWNSYDGYTMFDYPYLHLIGAGHSGGAQASCTDVGGGWARISVYNMIAGIPSNLSETYSAAAVYPVFYESSGRGGWNIGSLGEHITVAPSCTPNCSCAANTCVGQTCSDGCGGNCGGTKNCTQTTTCGGTLPGYAAWNTSSTYSQTWNGSIWTPTKTANYSTTASTDDCRFKCNTNYTWNGSSCVTNIQTTTCGGTFPGYAVWNTSSTYSQTWNGSIWTPTKTANYSITASTNDCRFKCNTNYTWNGSTCVADTKTVNCGGTFPNYTIWNTSSTYIQTWNGSIWTPTKTANYNTTASANDCRFKCNTNYTWNGSTCVADTKTVNCGGTFPGYAAWNTSNTYSQTWDGSIWTPTKTANYNITASTDDCRFECIIGYGWNGSNCVDNVNPTIDYFKVNNIAHGGGDVIVNDGAPVIVSWETHDDQSGVNRVEIWRQDITAGGSWGEVYETASVQNQWTDTTVVVNHDYRYGIHVIDNANNYIDGGIHSPLRDPIKAIINTSPTVLNMTAPNWSFDESCSLGAKKAILRWAHNDSSNQSGTAYRLILSTTNTPNSPTEFDTGKCTGYSASPSKCKIDVSLSSYQYILENTELEYNTPYYWWVQTWDEHGQPSALTQYNTATDTNNDDNRPKTFTTYRHEFPIVDFSWFPASPSKDEEVQFTDASKIYLDTSPASNPTLCGGNCSWYWSSSDAGISDQTAANPIITFNSSGDQTVTLKTTDNHGYYCSRTEAIDVNVALPGWSEVK